MFQSTKRPQKVNRFEKVEKTLWFYDLFIFKGSSRKKGCDVLNYVHERGTICK